MMCAVAKDSRSEPGAVCSQVSVCAGRGGGGTGGVYLFCDMCHALAHSMHILCTTHAHSLFSSDLSLLTLCALFCCSDTLTGLYNV